MTRAELSAVMDRTLAALRAQVEEVDAGILAAPVAEAVRLARVAIGVLAGEARAYVLGDGGPHGSPERAWRAWIDLAIDTENNLARGAQYQSRYSVAGWLGRLGDAAVDAARVVVDRASELPRLVALGVGLWVGFSLLSRGR